MAVESIAIAYDCLFPYTTGGGERQYRAFAVEARHDGRSVDYLTSRQWTDAAPEEDFGVVAVTGPLKLYGDGGVRRSSAAAAFAWGLFRALLRRRDRYDAVIVSGLPVLNVFAARAALAGTRTRVTVDYLEVWGLRQWAQYAGTVTGLIAWALQRAAIALTPIATCHSQLTADRLRAEGFRRTLLVSPGLIDPSSDPTPVVSAAVPPFVLYAGRHIPDKRVEALPAAVERARERVPGLELVILGSGPSTADVTAAAAGREWIRMPGFVSEERLDELMGGAACLVNPSRREGYGLVVVEASGYGTPAVLVHDRGNASTELITPGVNGFVAASANPDDLASAIVSAVEGGEELRARTRAWYEDAVRTRTMKQTVKRILAVLDGQPTPNNGDAPDDREEECP